MRVIYKGYAATTYGKTSLSVTDTDGREVYHSDNRKHETEEELINLIKMIRKGAENVCI